MSKLMTTATGNQFYTELINRFFHPKSYFFYCAKRYLDTPSSLADDPDILILQLLSQFMGFLNKSKHPAQNLQEMSQIKGFENIYSSLVSQLIRYDLRSLDQPQLKKAIQKIAQFFLKDIFQILSKNEKIRNTLTIYLDIKAKLIELLNGSNGTHNNKDATKSHKQNIKVTCDENISKESNPPSYPIKTSSFEFSPENVPKDSINLLENYFEKEIARLLKPLTKYSNETSEFYTNSDFIKQIYEIFSHIHELALYHGYEEVEVISERVAELLLSVLTMKRSINQPIIRLIYDSKAAVEKHIFHHQNLDNLKELLNSLDHFIVNLNSQEVIKELNKNVQISSPEDEKSTGFEINTSFNKLLQSCNASNQKINKSSIFSSIHAETSRSENVAEHELSEEDDEELLKLIQEINSTQEYSPAQDITEIKDIKNSESQITVQMDNISPENHQVNNNNSDFFINEIFQQEAALCYKILLNAVSNLKNEEKAQSALEDLELASSSLKHLAQKFSMEKFALLPELIESISITANKQIIMLPSLILQGIENGVNLLKEFDVNNTDHKTKFISILTLLKEYYSKTLNSTNKI